MDDLTKYLEFLINSDKIYCYKTENVEESKCLSYHQQCIATGYFIKEQPVNHTNSFYTYIFADCLIDSTDEKKLKLANSMMDDIVNHNYSAIQNLLSKTLSRLALQK